MPHDFGLVVLGQPPSEKSADQQRIHRSPGHRREAQHLELERALPSRSRCHLRVHTFRISRERVTNSGRRRLPFSLGRRAQSECQESPVDAKCRLAQQFRQPTRRGATIQFHLPQSIARMKDAGDEPGVFGAAGVDVRHAVTVHHHFNRRGQTRKTDIAVQSRERLAHPPPKPSARDGDEDDDEEKNAFHSVGGGLAAFLRFRLGWGAGVTRPTPV
jgi:hypothetical protein